jgi:cytoskeletal protein RodZ
MSDDKRDRDPWEDRYDQEDAVDESETSEQSEESKTSKRSQTAETAESSSASDTVEKSESEETSKSEERSTVRERKNVNMYLPDDLVSDMQLRYSELNVKWRREHDDDLPKNEVFYPAVISAALKGTSIDAEIGLNEE